MTLQSTDSPWYISLLCLFLFLLNRMSPSLLMKTRQINAPNWPAKQTRQNVLPWKHARSTCEYDPPNLLARDPPFPAQDPPGRTWLASLLPPPPPTAPPTEQGERGARSRPGPPVHLEQVLLLSHECLHILAKHNIHTFYTERIKQVYKYIAFRRRKNCNEGVRSWSPPGPVKGSICIIKAL